MSTPTCVTFLLANDYSKSFTPNRYAESIPKSDLSIIKRVTSIPIILHNFMQSIGRNPIMDTHDLRFLGN